MMTHGFFRFLGRFFRYIFTGKLNYSSSTNTIPVEEGIPDNEPDSRKLSHEQVKNKLIFTINKVLVVVCCLSFIVIIIYPFTHSGEQVPDTIQNAFFTTLGWFGGALGTFFQIEQSK